MLRKCVVLLILCAVVVVTVVGCGGETQEDRMEGLREKAEEGRPLSRRDRDRLETEGEATEEMPVEGEAVE